MSIKCFLENTQSRVQWRTGVNPFSVLLQNACSRKQSLGDQVQMNCERRNENRISSWKIMWIGTMRNMQNQLAAMYLQLSNLATKSFFHLEQKAFNQYPHWI